MEFELTKNCTNYRFILKNFKKQPIYIISQFLKPFYLFYCLLQIVESDLWIDCSSRRCVTVTFGAVYNTHLQLFLLLDDGFEQHHISLEELVVDVAIPPLWDGLSKQVLTKFHSLYTKLLIWLENQKKHFYNKIRMTIDFISMLYKS